MCNSSPPHNKSKGSSKVFGIVPNRKLIVPFHRLTKLNPNFLVSKSWI